MKIKVRSWQPLPALAAAFLFLSVLINLDYPAEHLFSWRLLCPSIDVWLLLVITALAAGWGKRPLFWAGLTVWVLFLALRLLRIGDIAVPMYLNRSFNLYIDSGYLFSLYDLLKTSSREGQFLIMASTMLTLALAAVASTGHAWRAAAGALADRRTRIWFLAGSGIVFTALLAGGWRPARPPALVRLGQEVLAVRQQLTQQRAFGARLEKTVQARAAGPARLDGLQGADVLMFIVESYGRTVFSRPPYRPAMQATLDAFARTLEQHGLTAVSACLESPTYGGSSWLAHSTLESGIRVKNDLEDAALLRSALPSLSAYFQKSGYRTVSVMPGVRFAYPPGSYFNYDQAYYARDFNYRGPTFGWAPMPDQFVLDWVRRREFVRRRQPLFVRYVLISSHAAYNIQPPFIPDWDAIGDGRTYHERPPVYYPIFWPDLKNAGEAYLRSLDYEFKTLGEYIARYVAAEALVVIMGDHQPNLQLTGAGEPWSVPVHVISGNRRLLEPFRKRGYTPGLTPAQPPPHAGMETFMPGFLEDFR